MHYNASMHHSIAPSLVVVNIRPVRYYIQFQYISKVSQNFEVGCVLQFEVPDVHTDYGLLNSELDYIPIPGI